MGFSRQEYWSGFLIQGIKLASIVFPALAGGFFTATPPGIGQKPRAIVKGFQTGVEIGSNLPPSLP